MTDNLYLALAAILLLPLIPAFILYKFLPAKDGLSTDEVGGETTTIGPVKTLSWKLKGAFAGYFLLVVVGLALQYFVMSNKQQKQIDFLSQTLKTTSDSIRVLQLQLMASANPVIDWHVKGAISPAGKEGTRFFYDDGTTANDPDGSFELIKRCIATQGKAKAPKWICVYNLNTGYKVISLNREIGHPDIDAFKISFNDTTHEIIIHKPIEINSNAKDSIVAVANFIESTPALKDKLNQLQPGFLEKANRMKLELQIQKNKNLQFEKMETDKIKAGILKVNS